MRRRRHSEGKDWPKRKLEAGNSLKLFAISIIEFLQQRQQRSQAQQQQHWFFLSLLSPSNRSPLDLEQQHGSPLFVLLNLT